MTRLAVSLSTLCAVLFALSLAIGPASIGFVESWAALFVDDGTPLTTVMREIRLPRSVLAFVVGFSLGLAGAAMQGYLRNPLAEPGLLGVSATAALGAVIAIYTGFASTFVLSTQVFGDLQIGLPLMALLGAMIGGLLIITLGGRTGGSLTLILAGIAISAMAGALTSLVLNLSPNPWAANEIVFWMMGSLKDRSMTHVWLALPLTLVGWVLLGRLGRSLDALTLGEDAAEAMGIDLARLRLSIVVGTACVVGSATAVAGAIGFVGLVVPHILRPLVGAKPSRLLWASALGGAVMVLAADIAVRVILPDKDLKLGVLTALVGTPIFLHLIFRMRRDL